MALDSTAAAAVGSAIATSLGFVGPAATAQAAVWTTVVQKIFDGIVANAVVSPAGVPPLSNGGGAVGGTGKVL